MFFTCGNASTKFPNNLQYGMTKRNSTTFTGCEAERTLKSRSEMYNNKNTHLEFTAFSQKALPPNV